MLVFLSICIKHFGIMHVHDVYKFKEIELVKLSQCFLSFDIMQPLSSMPMSVQSPPMEDEFELEEEDEEAEYASPPGSPSLNRRESRPPSTKSRPGSLRPDSRVSNDASSLCNSRPNSGVSSMRSRPTSNMSAMNSRSKSLSRINGKQSILQRSIIVSTATFC